MSILRLVSENKGDFPPYGKYRSFLVGVFFLGGGPFWNMKIQFVADKHLYLCLLIN